MVWTSEPLVSEVKSSRLVIEGPVQEFMLSVAPRGKDNNPTYLDVDNEKPDFGKGHFPWRCSGQFDSGPRMSPARYLCLLLRSTEFSESLEYSESTEYKDKAYINETFLILEPCSGTNMYQRVGIGNFMGERQSFDLTVRLTVSLI